MKQKSSFPSIRRLLSLKNFTNGIIFVCGAAILFSIFAVLSYTGTIDFAFESHTPLTPEQEQAATVSLIVGMVTLVVAMLLGFLCEKINAFIDEEIERRKQAIRRKRDRLRAQQHQDYENLHAFVKEYYGDKEPVTPDEEKKAC